MKERLIREMDYGDPGWFEGQKDWAKDPKEARPAMPKESISRKKVDGVPWPGDIPEVEDTPFHRGEWQCWQAQRQETILSVPI